MVEEAGQCSASDEDEEGRTYGIPSSRSKVKHVAEDEKFHLLNPIQAPVLLSVAMLQRKPSPSQHPASHPTIVHRYTNCSLVAEKVRVSKRWKSEN